MKSANPFVIVEDCKESIAYYQQILGGDINILHEQDGRVMHAELRFDGSLIHFSNSLGSIPRGENINIIMQFDTEAEIRQVYDKLAANGKVDLKLQDTFFGALHGEVTDNKNNIRWLLNYFRT